MILDKLLSKPARAKMIKIGLINIIQGKNCPPRIEPKIIPLPLNLNLEIAYAANNETIQAIKVETIQTIKLLII